MFIKRLLASSRDLLMSLEEETGLNSGWINNGGVFISHSKVSLIIKKIIGKKINESNLGKIRRI